MLADWVTQRWVELAGRRVSFERDTWLQSPAGSADGIGPDFFRAFASRAGLRYVADRPAGLLEDLAVLNGPAFDASQVNGEVGRFYVETSEYEFDAWAEWAGLFRPFGWLLARIFSRRLQQLNVPLSSLDTSRGISSEVAVLVDASGERRFAVWVRSLLATGRVLYAGAYSPCVLPDGTAGVRVGFPLPNGTALVVMRPSSRADGSLVLESSGVAFGEPGFYFTLTNARGQFARQVRSLRERIHVFQAPDAIRADHTLTLWRLTFLRVHYRMRRRSALSS